jgi:preprotein translocase subunit SecG
MENFIAVLHILVAVVLISLVLIQDSKGGGALGIGGGGTNSILGATGAQTLAAKLTTGAAIIFAITCLTLTFLSSRGQKSVLDTGAALPVPPATSAPAANSALPPTATGGGDAAAPAGVAAPAATAPAGTESSPSKTSSEPQK